MESSNYQNTCELCGAVQDVAVYMDTDNANAPIKVCPKCASEWNNICEATKDENKEQETTE